MHLYIWKTKTILEFKLDPGHKRKNMHVAQERSIFVNSKTGVNKKGPTVHIWVFLPQDPVLAPSLGLKLRDFASWISSQNYTPVWRQGSDRGGPGTRGVTLPLGLPAGGRGLRVSLPQSSEPCQGESLEK